MLHITEVECDCSIEIFKGSDSLENDFKILIILENSR